MLTNRSTGAAIHHFLAVYELDDSPRCICQALGEIDHTLHEGVEVKPLRGDQGLHFHETSQKPGEAVGARGRSEVSEGLGGRAHGADVG
jgi:hypothetical protein